MVTPLSFRCLRSMPAATIKKDRNFSSLPTAAVLMAGQKLRNGCYQTTEKNLLQSVTVCSVQPHTKASVTVFSNQKRNNSGSGIDDDHQLLFDIELHGSKTRRFTPLQYLLASLASCHSVTIRHVASHMGLHVGKIEHTRVEGWVDYRSLIKVEPHVPTGFTRVLMEVELEMDALSEEQVSQLKERVQMQSPMYSLIRATGTCRMTLNWTVVQPATR